MTRKPMKPRVPKPKAAPKPVAAASAARQAIEMERPGHLFHGPAVKSGPIRKLPTGSILYPTGKKSGSWAEVTDESDQKGWVSSRLTRTVQ